MSQKINPISFRLGLSQVWDTTFVTYGHNLQPYYFIFTKLELENYIKRFFISKYLLLGSSYWIIKHNKLVVIINYLNLKKSNTKVLKFNKHLSTLVTKWTNSPTKIYLLRNSIWSSSAELVISYIRITLQKENSLKKVIINTSKIINTQLQHKKTVYTIKGPLNLKLQGFKIISSGRFENSRSNMSKIIKYSGGSLPLPQLNNYVEYSYKEIYTKSGVCSLHVWMLYM
uniref:Ribosomal protein S3 n=1 Tax=Balbiania investiens TaxID=111861 RepID=A0A4D6BNG0_9FLOR